MIDAMLRAAFRFGFIEGAKMALVRNREGLPCDGKELERLAEQEGSSLRHSSGFWFSDGSDDEA